MSNVLSTCFYIATRLNIRPRIHTVRVLSWTQEYGMNSCLSKRDDVIALVPQWCTLVKCHIYNNLLYTFRTVRCCCCFFFKQKEKYTGTWYELIPLARMSWLIWYSHLPQYCAIFTPSIFYSRINISQRKKEEKKIRKHGMNSHHLQTYYAVIALSPYWIWYGHITLSSPCSKHPLVTPVHIGKMGIAEVNIISIIFLQT